MIYFDYTATTIPDSDIVKLHQKITTTYWCNSEALYLDGVKANLLVEKSKQIILDTFKVTNKDVLFTSGATEANNTAIYGICNNYLNNPKHIITTCVEHASVLNCFKDLEKKGFKVTYLPINDEGIINITDLENAITNDTILVSIMWVNNIIGSIMPINDIIKIVKKHPRIKLHIDAVQGIGKINPSFSFNDIDMFTCSSHKLHGLKGTGCLLYNKNINLNFLQGGHQQHGIRPGTVDVAGVVTTAKTIQMYGSFNKENYNKVYANYIYLVDKLSTLPFLIINKSKHAFSPYILSVTFCKIKGETVLHSLEEKGIYVSTGSACNSHSKDLDNTLMAFTKSETYAINTIRISLDYTTSKNEIDILINNIKMIGEK